VALKDPSTSAALASPTSVLLPGLTTTGFVEDRLDTSLMENCTYL
jgi:hypothetical protein